MSKIKEQLRLKLLGQLSDENTQLDVDNAYSVVRDVAVSFSVFCADFSYEKTANRWYKSSPFKNFPDYITTEELFKIFEK